MSRKSYFSFSFISFLDVLLKQMRLGFCCLHSDKINFTTVCQRRISNMNVKLISFFLFFLVNFILQVYFERPLSLNFANLYFPHDPTLSKLLKFIFAFSLLTSHAFPFHEEFKEIKIILKEKKTFLLRQFVIQ